MSVKTNKLQPYSASGIAVGDSPSFSHASSIMDIQSTSKGLLAPRMTTVQRDAIVSPAEGLLIYNLDDNRLEQYSSGQWTVAGNGQSPVKNVLRVVKNAVLNDGDFSSIEAALASITDNSPSNQYIIECGPGIFIENPLHMKPYVYITGLDFDATVIQANDPTEHLIFATEFSSISNCMLTGVTLGGKALIYYASATGTPQTAFWAEDVRFGASDTLAIADGTVAHSNLFINSCRWGGIFSFNTGFIARTSGSTLGRVIMRNSTSSRMTAPFPVDMFVVDGTGCELHLNSIISRTGQVSAGGNAIRVRNGGFLRILSADMDGWSKGLWVENVGSACTVVGGLLTLINNTTDIQIDPSTVLGGIIAAANDDMKLSINPMLTNFGFGILGLEDGDIAISGKVKQYQPDGVFTDITTLATDSSPMGILSSGNIDPVSGSTIRVDPGLGYLQKSDGSLRKVVWSLTNITLPDNLVSIVYVDSNGIVQHNAVAPNSVENIIIGRVGIISGNIIFIEEAGALSTHSASQIGIALREGIGAVFADGGSTVSENGTRNLNVTAGKYFYGERPFYSQGGSPITFSAFYSDGVGGHIIVPSITQVINDKWDDGTGILASLSSGYYAKHTLYMLGDSTGDFDSEVYFLVYSQAQYSALTLAQQGNLPTPPPFMTGAITTIASIIVQEGTTNIVEIRDERPRIGSTASAVAASSFHSGLLGLTTGDDHPQYWRNDGTHLATGDFDLNTHALKNVTTVNSVAVENHHARHQTGGADAIPVVTTSVDGLMSSTDKTKLNGVANNATNTPLGTATPQPVSSTASAGSSTNASKEDHSHVGVHSIHANAGSNRTGDLSLQNGIGIAITDDGSGNFTIANTAPATFGSPSSISKNSNADGVSTNIVRADHTHRLTASAASNDHIPKFDGTDWQPVYPEAQLNPSNAWRLHDEFMAGNNSSSNNSNGGDARWFFNKSGASGSMDTNLAAVTASNPGVIKLISAGAGGSYSSMLLGGIILGNGSIELEYLINFDALADVTNDWVFRVGLGDTTNADHSNGVYFEYNRSTSTNWLIKTANAGVRTSTTTSTAVVATSWIKLHISINAAANSVTFYVNGVSVGTITTNIPTLVTQLSIHQTRSAGTPTGVEIDYMDFYQRFTSSR